jgi:hypothetical protein
MSVANGDVNTAFDQRCDVLDGLAEVRRESHHTHDSGGGLLPAIELGDGGRANGVGGMGASITVERRYVRAFHVDEWNASGRSGIAAARLGDDPEPAAYLFFGRRDQRGRETSDSASQHGVDEADDGSYRDVFRIQIKSGTAVHL